MKLHYQLLSLGLMMALWAGCKSAEPKWASPSTSAVSPSEKVKSKLDPELLRPPQDLFVLGPGDQIDIEILGKAASRTTSTVGLDGKIYYSFLPGIDVWGLPLSK